MWQVTFMVNRCDHSLADSDATCGKEKDDAIVDRRACIDRGSYTMQEDKLHKRTRNCYSAGNVAEEELFTPYIPCTCAH